VCWRTGFSCMFCRLLSVLSIKFFVWWKTGFTCMFCQLLSIISIQLYRVLMDRFQLHLRLVTVNPINTIVPCGLGQESAACSACYCQYYQYNCIVWWKTGFTCMFCQLLSILSIQLYRVLMDRFQLHLRLVTVNPINTIVPCGLGQDSAACSACYCQYYQYNCIVWGRTGISCMFCRLV